MNIPLRFLRVADALGDHEAIQEGERCLRYREFLAASLCVGEKIREATDAQNVALFLPNGIGCAVGFFAITLAGKTAVPVNFLLKPGEIKRIILDSQVDTIITAEPLAGALAGAGPEVILIEKLMGDIKPASFKPPDVAPDDIAAILYTSGTSAEPKGVMQSHRNILSNIDACLRALSISKDDVFLSVLPLFHTFGLTCTFLLPVLTGAKVVLTPRFVPASIPELIRSRKVTVMLAAPSMYRAMLKSFTEAGGAPECLRLCASGGEQLPTALAGQYEDVTGMPLLEGYGMTETSPVISMNRLDSIRRGTVGRPLDSVEVCVLDAKGARVPTGAEGEICVRGENVMVAYWRRPDATREIIDSDGWLHTGDLGRVDDDGFIAITGRKKELIISAGKNISPVEIERVLEAHPSVGEAAVIGVPDNVRGEVPRAFVVLREGTDLSAQELLGHCREHLAEYKRPRSIEFVEDLPRSLTGKVLKRMLGGESIQQEDRDETVKM